MESLIQALKLNQWLCFVMYDQICAVNISDFIFVKNKTLLNQLVAVSSVVGQMKGLGIAPSPTVCTAG